MSKNSVILTEVEEFIRRWNNGELALTDIAKDMIVTYKNFQEKNLWGKPKTFHKPLPDYLGWGISTYQYAREVGYFGNIYQTAYELLDTIQRARAYGAIVDAKQQVSDYQSEIKQLKEQVNSLMKLNDKLAQENKVLHTLASAKTKTKGGGEIGDVEK